MASLKLTDGLVEGIEPGSKDVYVWDTALTRFGVRVTPAGSRIYLVQYRAKAMPGEASKTRRITIGQHDGDLWNVTKARAAARKLLAPVDLAQDPFAAREAERQAAAAARAALAEEQARQIRDAELRARDSFSAVADRYIDLCLSKNRSGGESARLLRHGPVKAWADRYIVDIRRSDVADLIDRIKGRSGPVARATYAALRGLFGWCVERDLIAASPCEGLTAPPRPQARDRVLADEELKAIWCACDELGAPFGPLIQLLMLTGQRRAEVAGMRRSELDLAAATWRIPADRAKNGKAHEIDLCPKALAIIAAVPDQGDYLFPARQRAEREAGGAVRGFSATKRKLDELIEAARRKANPQDTKPGTPWRLHDLRRTAATGMAAMNFPPHVVERVLNHVSNTQAGLVGVYQRHEYRAERKAASLAWGAQVEMIRKGEKLTSNVRALRR